MQRKVPESLQSKLVTYFRMRLEVTALVRGSDGVNHASGQAEK